MQSIIRVTLTGLVLALPIKPVYASKLCESDLTQKAFWQSINEKPTESALWFIFADWASEQNDDTLEAELRTEGNVISLLFDQGTHPDLQNQLGVRLETGVDYYERIETNGRILIVESSDTGAALKRLAQQENLAVLFSKLSSIKIIREEHHILIKQSGTPQEFVLFQPRTYSMHISSRELAQCIEAFLDADTLGGFASHYTLLPTGDEP